MLTDIAGLIMYQFKRIAAAAEDRERIEVSHCFPTYVVIFSAEFSKLLSVDGLIFPLAQLVAFFPFASA